MSTTDAQIANLATKIEKRLPSELIEFMQAAGLVAASRGRGLYLVGGVVRDLLLGRDNLDLDLVVEGDAIELAGQLVGINRSKVIIHPRFGTAKLRWDRWSVDIATIRSETYERPGALPTVKPDTLANDLFRRDFTINAMAIELSPTRWGSLIDLYGGREDIDRKLIRVLHQRSFIDDATRIWRAVRYEQRLGFRLEAATRRLLKRDLPMLYTITGDRMRHELELVLKEEFPERALHRADQIGVLAKLHPSLKGNGWLAAKFGQARELCAPGLPPEVGLALLTYHLSLQEKEEVISLLNLSKNQAQVIRDTNRVREALITLSRPGLRPSHVYRLLDGCSPLAISTGLIATRSPTGRRHMQAFLDELRHVKPILNGDDLKKLGILPGARLKEILDILRVVRLDGKTKDRQDEVDMVSQWMKKHSW